MNFALFSQGRKWGSFAYGSSGGDVPWSFWRGSVGGEGFPYSGVFSTVMQADTRRALDAWEAIANINFIEVPDGTFPAQSGLRLGLGALDGRGNDLAFAHRKNYSNNTTRAAEIIVDTAEGWHIRNGVLVNSYGTSFYSIVLHEIGHTLGLAHYSGALAVMNPRENPSITSLQSSDIQGARYIYGTPVTAWGGTSSHNDLFRFDTIARPLTINGNAGTDVLYGGERADVIKGGADRDIIAGGLGADVLYGDTDATSSSGAADHILGDVGNDTIYGGAGGDYLHGESGNDTVGGGLGNDLLYGGFGADVLRGDAGNDEIWGGTPATLKNAWYGSPISVNWDGPANRSRPTTAWVLDGFVQSSDTGNDYLDGGAGNDYLSAGAGNDRLIGGPGNDRMYGGSGSDTFIFRDAPNSTTNKDTIHDFNVAADIIHLENAVFTALVGTGTLSVAQFHIGSSAADASDRIIYNPSTGTVTYDANGSASGGAQQFALLTAGLALTRADFFIV